MNIVKCKLDDNFKILRSKSRLVKAELNENRLRLENGLLLNFKDVMKPMFVSIPVPFDDNSGEMYSDIDTEYAYLTVALFKTGVRQLKICHMN